MAGAMKYDVGSRGWYTDSFDNHYVIDHLPGQDSVLVATGGSGHAFKYLLNIDKWIVRLGRGRPGQPAGGNGEVATRPTTSPCSYGR
jgi:hypothetical protein